MATGGRYDRLLRQFGKDAASIGFAIHIDSLLTAMERQKIQIETDITGTILLYDREQKEKAIRLAGILRADGTYLQLMKKYHEKSLEDYIALAKRSQVGGVLYLDKSGKTVLVINVEENTRSQVSIQSWIGDEA